MRETRIERRLLTERCFEVAGPEAGAASLDDLGRATVIIGAHRFPQTPFLAAPQIEGSGGGLRRSSLSLVQMFLSPGERAETAAAEILQTPAALSIRDLLSK